MSSSYTTLLGLVLPVEGELIDTWGDVVNAQLTQLIEDSVAGYSTKAFTSIDLTWTLTATGSGAQNEARTAILIATGTPGATCTIYAPKSSKTYVVVNNLDSLLYIKGGPTSPTAGVSITANQSALVAWNSSTGDFVKVAGGGGGATGGGNDVIFFENGQTVTTSYTLPTVTNAGTFGPVSVDSGVVVTVPDSSSWTVV